MCVCVFVCVCVRACVYWFRCTRIKCIIQVNTNKVNDGSLLLSGTNISSHGS